MTHQHHHHDHNDADNIKVAFILNLLFTILEIVGGIWTNSMAIVSDALHDLGDSLSLGIAWYLEKKSQRKPDDKFSFGYARFSLLGAVINSLVLVGGSVLVLTRSIPRIFAPEQVKAEGMLVFALFGIAINLIAMLKMKKGSSLNQKTVSWHLLEDVLGWVAVLIASIVLMFVDIPVLDPILSIGITIYVLYNAIKNLRQVIDIFLQCTPAQYSIEQIEDEIEKKFDIIDAYHTHIWSLDGEKNLLSTHIVVSDDMSTESIIQTKKEIREHMMTKEIEHTTIEVEFDSEEIDSHQY